MILTLVASAGAGEIGHFNGGVMNIRDYLVPEPGFYAASFNYFYTSDQLNDSAGNQIKTVTIVPPGGGPSVTLNVDVNVDVHSVSPTLIWVTDVKPLGLKYGALITATVADTSLSASLAALNGRGVNADNSSFGAGDLLVQPVWLGWTRPHWDVALAYAFYAPIGKYDTETVTLPVVGPVKVESADNIGYGFWTHQIQGAAAWYPMTNRATAVVAALTYETNGKKEGFDLTPGDVLTLNWGISQYLPLKKDLSLLLEVGPAGYDMWQITDDTGRAATSTRDRVHAVGGQLGLTCVPWALSLNVHGFYEFAAQARLQGASVGINIAKRF